MEGEMTKQNTIGVSIWIFYLTSIIHSDGGDLSYINRQIPRWWCTLEIRMKWVSLHLYIPCLTQGTQTFWNMTKGKNINSVASYRIVVSFIQQQPYSSWDFRTASAVHSSGLLGVLVICCFWDSSTRGWFSWCSIVEIHRYVDNPLSVTDYERDLNQFVLYVLES